MAVHTVDITSNPKKIVKKRKRGYKVNRFCPVIKRNVFYTECMGCINNACKRRIEQKKEKIFLKGYKEGVVDAKKTISGSN